MPRCGGHRARGDRLGTAGIDSLTHDDPTGIAGRLIGIMSVLSPDGVCIDLLHAIDIPDNGDADSYGVDDAIERCTRHSLLSWSVHDDALIMHRLTARVVRERAAATGTLGALIAGAVSLLEPRLFDGSEAWSRRDLGAHLVAQIEALWETAATESDTDITLRTPRLRTWAVQQLRAAADLTRAIDIGERTLADSERVLGADHPDTLTSRSNLAGAYRWSAGATGRGDPAVRVHPRRP